jgi:hypothetical protein
MFEQVERNSSDYAITLELLKELQLIADSTEQPRSRPSNQKEQQEYFSGKKNSRHLRIS